MFINTDTESFTQADVFATTERASSPGAAMPRSIVASERAVAIFRAHLNAEGLSDYQIAYCRDVEIHDVEHNLREIDTDAEWRAAPSLVGDGAGSVAGESLAIVTSRGTNVWHWNGGFLHLPRFRVVMARWYFVTADAQRPSATITLMAAPSSEAYVKLLAEVTRYQRRRGVATWQVLTGYTYADEPPQPRDLGAGDELVLPAALRERVSIDVLRFFSEEVAALYRELAVPYRRGVLLYGPPGNGKTSLIRWIGAQLSNIPAMLLRPACGFDADQLTEVVRRWRRHAPAILVIEDLDWLIKELNVSTFLNLLDGIDSEMGEQSSGGLLLIATTNHPEKLDPAINSRPGRFDVVVEIPSPTPALREEFLRRKLPALGEAALVEVVRSSDGFSFAHLHEVLRLSGLLAIASGRSAREDAEVVRATREVAYSRDDAGRGFTPKPEVPFGLGALRDLRKI